MKKKVSTAVRSAPAKTVFQCSDPSVTGRFQAAYEDAAQKAWAQYIRDRQTDAKTDPAWLHYASEETALYAVLMKGFGYGGKDEEKAYKAALKEARALAGNITPETVTFGKAEINRQNEQDEKRKLREARETTLRRQVFRLYRISANIEEQARQESYPDKSARTEVIGALKKLVKRAHEAACIVDRAL